MVCFYTVFISEPLAKVSFHLISALCLKFYPRNIIYMPVVKFFACLDLERKPYFCKRLICFNFAISTLCVVYLLINFTPSPIWKT